MFPSWLSASLKCDRSTLAASSWNTSFSSCSTCCRALLTENLTTLCRFLRFETCSQRVASTSTVWCQASFSHLPAKSLFRICSSQSRSSSCFGVWLLFEFSQSISPWFLWLCPGARAWVGSNVLTALPQSLLCLESIWHLRSQTFPQRPLSCLLGFLLRYWTCQNRLNHLVSLCLGRQLFP